MKSSFIAAIVYLILGVGSGVFYREFTKANSFEGSTQLGVVHTHLLVLGFIFFLLVVLLERVFGIARGPVFAWFFWTYNVGLVVTTGAMVTHGSLTVLGEQSTAAIAGIAGMGHILLTVGLILFMTALGRRVFEADRATHEPRAAATDSIPQANTVA